MEELINNFRELIKNDKLSHSYLFFGAGEEKFTFSQALANFLEKGEFSEPKGILTEFLAVSPDEKGTIGIEEIRNLKYFLWQKPIASLKRIVIIENAQALTAEAQNAALKIVEEPPERGLIIFLAKTAEDLLPTLNSRLQKIYFSETSKKSGARKLEDETDEFFRKSIAGLMKDPVKNSVRLKEILRRLVLVKQLNLNKKLQLRSLE
ncbi:MAG: hypothetical protein D4Q79_01485 [Spirochaetia bacterium]|nr:MAG: hypothetical protein D4Q79_01485 [Spirochaetia bacterium]